MKNAKRGIAIFAIAIIPALIIALILLFAFPTIENRTWVLSYAQQSEAPHSVVAHNTDYDFSNDESGLFAFSKPIDLICEAKDGNLLLTDKTNGKTYEGTYKLTSGGFGRFGAFTKKSYTVVIDGLEGTADFSTNRTLRISVGGHYLNFEIQ